MKKLINRVLLPVAVLAPIFLMPAAAGPARATRSRGPSARELAAMKAAIEADGAVKGGPCERFDFTFGREAGGFAVGTVAQNVTDPAWVVLQRVGTGWKVVVLGTGITGRELRELGVPQEIARDFE